MVRTLLRDEARARSRLLEVTAYDVELDLTGAADFGSQTTVRFGCREPGATTFVELDAEVVSATLNGRSLPPAEGNRIPLPDLAADNELRVVARGRWSRSGEGLHRFVDPADGRVYVWAQSFLDDAQRIFACFDQPDLKAPVALTVIAPEDWTVVANGRGTRAGSRWTFATTPRIATYAMTVCAGPWHGVSRWHDGIELGVWCRQSLAPYLEAEELLELTAQFLDHYQELFASRYPFGDSYDQLWVPEFNHGAMENPGAVTFSEQLLFRSRVTQAQRRSRAEVIAHEMAHMWFGNLVTMRWWDDLWLNESFAELMGVHATQAATRFAGGWTQFCTGRKAWGYRADQLPTTHPISGPVADNRSALANFDGISYAKGASVLRQLMALLGEQTFLDGVRRYLQAHAFRSTTLADFLAAQEEASGRDLGPWAQAWLRTPGVSTLRLQGAAVRQEAPERFPVLRTHRIGIGRYVRRGRALEREELLDVEVSGELTPVPGLAAPADLVVLNDGDLSFAKVRLDERSLHTVEQQLRQVADPLSRAVCWAALWDAARDAELPVGRYVAAVLAHAEGEDDPGLLAVLATRAQTGVTWSGRPDVAHRWYDGVREALGRAAPGGDLQLGWARAAVDAAADPSWLEGLLAGRGPDGLVVDTELRWQVVQRLAVLGAVAEERIAAELERDRTAAGERHADRCMASRPVREAKERVWDRLLGDQGLSNHQVDALAGGFWHPEQVELCRPWVARYFEQIAAAWDARSPQLARSLAVGLYPGVVLEPSVLTRTDALLQEALPDGLRRVLLEQRDELRRAVAVRTAAG